MSQDEGNWIQGAIKKPGALRKLLKVPAGKDIPVTKLEKAAHSKNSTTRKRANLALTLKKFNTHSKGKIVRRIRDR